LRNRRKKKMSKNSMATWTKFKSRHLRKLSNLLRIPNRKLLTKKRRIKKKKLPVKNPSNRLSCKPQKMRKLVWNKSG
jgi:hypothetical protein